MLTALLSTLMTTIGVGRSAATREVAPDTAVDKPDTAVDKTVNKEHTELKDINAELTRTVRDLETFAGDVSHALKSPLATVTGYLQLLAHAHPDEIEELAAGISHGVDHMSRLIDDLLAYASAPQAPLRPARVDLSRLVHRVVATRNDGVRLRGKAPADISVDALPPVLGDEMLLYQVMDNLVGNALKYTRPGLRPQVRITGHEETHGRVRVEVADRGIGIPDGQHDAVFVGFHRAHRDAGYPGTGLGLAICRRIAQRHGGDITARPNPGGGTRFILTLPAAAIAHPATGATDPESDS